MSYSACVYICMYICTSVCMYIHMYVHVYVCMYVRVYLCYMYMNMFHGLSRRSLRGGAILDHPHSKYPAGAHTAPQVCNVLARETRLRLLQVFSDCEAHGLSIVGFIRSELAWDGRAGHVDSIVLAQMEKY